MTLTDQPEAPILPTPTPGKDAGAGERRPLEEFLAPLEPWQQAAIKASLDKPQGFMLSAEDFQKAADAALNEVIR